MDDRASEEQRAALFEDQKQKIIASVFRNLDETYVSHLKIWDGGGPGAKPRYILLSQGSSGTGYIHKSKLNQNETFSVGKTWLLSDLRSIAVNNPVIFNLTLSRTYQWESAFAIEQANFLEALIKLFRTVTGGASSLHLEGLRDPDNARPGRQRVQSDYMRSARTPSPSGIQSPSKRSQFNSRAPTPTQSARAVTPSHSEFDMLPRPQSRPSSPALSARANTASSRPRQPSISRLRPASPSQSSSGPSRTRPSNTAQPTPPNGLSSGRQSPINTQRINGSAPPPPMLDPAPPPRQRTASLAKTRKVSKTDNSTSDTSVRPDPLARISFFDPPNQAAIDRLILGGIEDADGEDGDVQASLANVEEMLEGYELASDDIIGRKTRGGAADLIEARLLDELLAMEKANIHSFLESDDRIGVVLKYMDEAIAELDNMSSLVSSYKIHLNDAADDISYIQSQHRGLQVQTQNQRALLAELENLLQTVQVDKAVLLTLSQESLEKPGGIQRLEEAASELYKALQAGRDTDMAATMERLQEYRTHNSQFCKRIFDYLTLRFTVQSKLLLGDSTGLTAPDVRSVRPVPTSHQELEAYFNRYSGLMLYLKEMDESIYAKLCAAYFSAVSELHSTQIKSMLTVYLAYVKRANEEESEASFTVTPTPNSSKSTAGMRRAGTLIRSPLEGRKDKDKSDDGDMRASDVFGLILEQIATLVYHEEDFVTKFLQFKDSALTYADYMGLDSYFRRQATRGAGISQSTLKLVRGAMDLIFGFLPLEIKSWVDSALAKDNMQIFGMLVCLERFQAEMDEKGNEFLISILGKQHTRLKSLLDRHINEQIQNVEQTKLSSRKRKGVAPFVKHFPVYIGRVESQLIGSDGLEIRGNVYAAYDRLVQTMFESLKQMAKMEGEGEDKSQLNYHVILIENMHHFVDETRQLEIGSVVGFVKRAEAIYDENLNAYVKMVLRRPFAKIIDYFEGIERLLQTTAPTEIANNSSYGKSALKKVVKEYSSKDVRKQIESLFKRVEKHFNSDALDKPTADEGGIITPGTVLAGVWKACEDELLRITELFSKRISQCYGDSGITLDYTVGDVEGAFKRHRVGS